MHRFTHLAVLVLPLLAIVGCGGPSLEHYRNQVPETLRQTTPVVEGLSLSLHSIKDRFYTDEMVIVEARITNNEPSNSDRVINVHTELYTGLLLYFDIVQLDDEKSPFVYRADNDDTDIEKNLARYSNHVRLRPGFSIGRPIHFSGSRLKPGIYQMTARYDNRRLRSGHCYASPHLTSQQLRMLESPQGNPGMVPVWVGTLQSNVILFEVVEAKKK